MYEADRPTVAETVAETVAQTPADTLPGAVPGLIYSVAELNQSVEALLNQRFPEVWVRGELSNLARPGSGHLYFTLKDDTAEIRSVMFRGRLQRLRFKPENGLEVVCRASVGLYVPRGSYQIIVEAMDLAGAGALQARFEALKQKLSSEGLFDATSKRPLPRFPRRIGVVTSATGAAIRDILAVLARRAPGIEVIIYPCLVQGTTAAASIVGALDVAYRRQEVDVLIVARGGGSLEDLWPFNEESVARRLAEAPMPTISGVGHETDFSISDMVADVRAPTPSAAAELCSKHLQEVSVQLKHLDTRLMLATDRILASYGQRLTAATRALTDPTRLLTQTVRALELLQMRLTRGVNAHITRTALHLQSLSQRLGRTDPRRSIALHSKTHEALKLRLLRGVRQNLDAAGKRHALATARLHALSPLATLNRGYAIAYSADGRAIRDAAAVAAGATVTVRVQHGEFAARRTDGESGADS